MKKFSLGLETIDFQKDETFQQFTALFDDFKKSNFEDTKLVKQIKELTFKRFGINTNIKVVTNHWIGTSVELPSFQLNHGLFNQAIRDILKTAKDADEDYQRLVKLKDFKKQNTVDLKNAKVAGILSELVYGIYLDTEQLRHLDPEEYAAVYLHEVGHLFTYFEQMVKITTANLVMLNVASLAQKNLPYENKLFAFELADDILEVDHNKINPNLVNNDTAVVTVYLSKITYQTKSTTGSSWYDNVSTEQSADQFVSRLGGGRYLIMALDKLYKRDGYFLTKKQNYYMSFGLGIFSVMVAGLFTIFGGLFGGLFFIFYVVYIFWFFDYNVFSHASGKLTYDDVKIRFKRMRNDLVTTLKYSKDDDYKKCVIKEIDFIDNLIADYVEEMDFSKLIDFILRRKDKGIYYLQRDLEDIAFNDLFIKAEKLRLSN